tara:strand:+ start:1898 stop:2122 length:225 start_codon:yes stop_codon:yes gene_type:complete
MSKVVELKHHHSTTPTIENRKVLPTPPKYSQVREREYLTSSEIERISKAAKSICRHGHRNSTIIMIAFHHVLHT